MNSNLNRAVILLQQSRYELAEQELRRALAEAPHDADVHALLGVCLANLDKLDEAEAEAGQAIALAPDWAYSHYCRSHVLERRRKFADAEAAAREAVRLEPGDADNHARLAATLYAQGKWQVTLASALQGLQHNAEHDGCSHLRTMALTKLNRQDEAIQSVDQSLARDPDNAVAHANKGWALLHQREPRKALDHFREALRLDPTYEYARAGMVEALKAHNPIYRWMLAYFLWMARLSNGARWGVILGGYFGYRLLSATAKQAPEFAPWIWPILIAYLVFAAMTWFAAPLFNLLLRLNRFGRHALSPDQRAAANWFGACLAAFAASVTASWFSESELPIVAAIISLGMAMPLTTLYVCDVGWPRQAMTMFAGAMAAVGLLTLLGVSFNQPWAHNVYVLFIIGVVATPWVANALVSATPTR